MQKQIYKLRAGDMLETSSGVGVVTKVRQRTIQYWTSNRNGPGAYFDENKDTIYSSIKDNKCKVYLGIKKYRRRHV